MYKYILALHFDLFVNFSNLFWFIFLKIAAVVEKVTKEVLGEKIWKIRQVMAKTPSVQILIVLTVDADMIFDDVEMEKF